MLDFQSGDLGSNPNRVTDDKTSRAASRIGSQEREGETDLLVRPYHFSDKTRQPPSLMQPLLLRKSTKVRRTNTAGDAEKCQRPDGLSGKEHGQCSTVRTAKGNLTIIQGVHGISAGYDENTTRRIAGRRKRHYGGARNHQTSHLTVGKSVNQCRCGRSVLPAYHLEGRCEDCFALDQERYNGRTQNVRLFHTVR